VAFGAGRFGRRELLERGRGKLRVDHRHLARADRWFDRYGSSAVFFARMLPIVRTFISLPAGAARMPVARFSLLTVAGCIPWVLLLMFVGEQVGRSWNDWRGGLEYLDSAVLAAAGLGPWWCAAGGRDPGDGRVRRRVSFAGVPAEG
jgi:membrane protein DedA with SNARE-associated domain